VVASPSHSGQIPRYWPSARHFTEVIQCPSVCFASPVLRNTMPAVDRLGMPIVTSGQFAYVYKLKSTNGHGDFAVRCFRGYLGDRDQRYRAIQDHVQSLPVGCLSEFRYAPEGILVGGQRYPILFMRWLDGPTLDLYVGEMLHRRDVVLHLADEWLRVVMALEASGIAHGDLQHGNVIVEHGQLRLIDHDGIFVPAMNGWSASEVGHQHYQHPHRTAQQFDKSLDNFSALVIYLSLLALAERPTLWQEYHDENLLFTKADFQNPSASSLFQKIKEIGTEHCRLADVLANAASGPPNAVPRLLDLVQAPSRLPAWMTAPADLETETKTREVALAEAAAETRTARWLPWDETTKERPMPTSPASSSVQSVFSAGNTSAVPVPRDPTQISQNSFFYAKEFFRQYFFWWYWGAYVLFQFSGLGFTIGFVVATLAMTLFALIWGIYKANELAHTARLKQAAALPSTLSPAPAPRRSPPSWQTVTHVYPLPAPAKPTQPIVGNRVLGIYHVEDCDWVDQITAANMVTFASPSEAASHGYKACRICSPAT
jgi:predicted Ser/Thr protein kinase